MMLEFDVYLIFFFFKYPQNNPKITTAYYDTHVMDFKFNRG